LTSLVGRDALVRSVTAELDAGHSVLLYGPEAIGKSAIVAASARDGVVVIDPFQHVARQQAARIRRALDRGVVHLGAARVSHGPELGAVGRVLWRFRLVRVRELAPILLTRIVTSELEESNDPMMKPERAWVREVASLAGGRPGFAAGMARFAVTWHRQHGYLPLPALAFAASREDAVIRTLPASPPISDQAGR